MAKDFSTLEDSNRSSNPGIHDVSDPARRVVLRGGMGLAAATFFAPLAGCTSGPPPAAAPRLGFEGLAASTADAVVVPEGYTAQVLAPWGEPVGVAGAMPGWAPDASNS
ncbi:MAG TPA: PhoX family phosphatase, partial [Rubrivivax sp.]|nr:PhoX family phosphatase [Rubrivivax sp.]